MTGIVKGWITGLAAASLIAAVLSALSPPGKARRVTAFASGFLIIAALIRPLIGLDASAFSAAFSRYGDMGSEYAGLLEKENARMLASIIEERAGAYISDKAQSLGIENISVSVRTAKGDGDYPYPNEVYIITECTNAQRRSLSTYLEKEFGIPPERQHWSGTDG